MKLRRLNKYFLPLLGTCPAVVLAVPTGGDVVGGSASISSPSPQGTVINQSSAKAIINWQSFSIAGDEYVQFNQPSTSSISLNRVVGGDPSSILGRLSATGQVFLVNPNGIYFGPGAQLDVGGLVASTLDIGDDDFLNGNYIFNQTGSSASASVINDGIIQARDNGYVVLASASVINNGIIEAKYGQIALVAGGGLTLDLQGDGLVSFSVDARTTTALAGVENTGQLLADGGRIVLTGHVSDTLVATAVNNSGLIQAHGIAEQNGEIFLLAEGGDIINSGTLDASGTDNADGGAVIVRGDEDIELTAGSLIAVNGDGSGDGGVVTVVADGSLTVNKDASIYASGGSAVSGNGGFIEVSGHKSLGLAGTVTAGSGGLVLIDPATVNIGSTSGGSTIDTAVLVTALNAGNDVIVAATTSVNLLNALTAVGSGDLTLGIGSISAPCAGSAFCTMPATFTATTGGTIDLNNNNISVGANLAITALGGTITNLDDVRGKNVTLTANNIISNNDTVNILATNNGGGNLTINSNFTATGLGSPDITFSATNNITINGNVNVSGTADTGSIAFGTFMTNGTVTTNGNVSLGGTLSTGRVNYETSGGTINVNGNVNVSASSANINVGGSSGSAGLNVNGNLVATGISSGYVRLQSGGRNVAINSNVTASGVSFSRILVGNSDGAAGAVTGGGVLNANIVEVYSDSNIALNTNAQTIKVFGGGGSSIGDVFIDNTRRTGPTGVQLGVSSLNAKRVKLDFGGDATINGQLNATAISMFAPGNLTALGGFDVAGDFVPGVMGDDVLTSFLVASGIMDGNGTSAPNASFVSGGTLSLDVGSLASSNQYLFLAADTLVLSGTSSAANLLVQMLPFTASNPIGFDATTPGTQMTNYTEAGHFSHFTGTTIALGGSLQSGGILIGANGPIDIGSKNLILLSASPSVIGVDQVTTTGLVAVLAAVFPTVLLDEVSSTSSGDTVDDPDKEDGDAQDDEVIAVEEGGIKDNVNLACS